MSRFSSSSHSQSSSSSSRSSSSSWSWSWSWSWSGRGGWSSSHCGRSRCAAATGGRRRAASGLRRANRSKDFYQICFLSATLYFVLATCRPLWSFLRAASNEYNDRLTRENCWAGPCGAQGLMCRPMGRPTITKSNQHWRRNGKNNHHHHHKKIECYGILILLNVKTLISNITSSPHQDFSFQWVRSKLRQL